MLPNESGQNFTIDRFFFIRHSSPLYGDLLKPMLQLKITPASHIQKWTYLQGTMHEKKWT